MSTPDLCYTYIYYDPSRNNEPIYVGQGINDRVWVHFSRKGIVQCPHCGKEGGSSGMGRWHFNRCKYKDN